MNKYQRALEASKLDKEIWTNVANPYFKDYYLVSNLGRVKSLDRLMLRSNGRPLVVKSRILKMHVGGQGYVRVILSHNSVSKMYQVHKLMLLSFLGKPPKGHVTRHLNGDPGYNKLFNLKFGTLSQNQLDRRRHGTDQRGENNPTVKLSEKEVIEIRNTVLPMSELRVKRGSIKDLAEKFGVSKSTIRSIRSGKGWQHV
jgi:hypothetical protein